MRSTPAGSPPELDSTSAAAVDRLALVALMDGVVELQIGQGRYRLSQEKVFRLEECSGGFVFYLRDAAALRRRVRALGGDRRGGVRGWALPARGN